MWVPFGSYLLNSTANPAQFEWKWAGLAVLFSRQIPNISHNSPLAPADFEIKVKRIAHSIVHFDQWNKLISKM